MEGKAIRFSLVFLGERIVLSYHYIAMIIPVRCFTCGKVIGNKYDWYLDLLVNGCSARYILFLQS
jgi:hypothetical protein